tara:strand:+ start:821 stop:1840 length:1020 start_codon:yes stop_codon:yes gene_type:complete
MSKSKDFMSLGEAYKDVFNKVIVSEDVPPGTTGEAPLIQGGPEEKGGFRPPLVDITKMSEKDKKDNIYNIKGYTYGDGNDPGDCNEPEPTGPTFGQVAYTGNVGPEEDEEEKRPDYPDVDGDGDTDESMEKALKDKKKGKKGKDDEEDEEFLEEHEKIARDGLNNFMSKTSVFDKLYNKVMVNENFGEDAEDITDIEALGIETDVEVDEVPETIAVSIPGELAQTLCNILQTAIAQQETEVDIDVDVEEVTDTQFEEDEEAAMKDGGGYGVDAGSTLKHDVNYGHGGKNKVGKLKSAGAATDVDGGGYGVDAGSTLKHEVDMGKKNTVGNTKLGSIPGA